MQEVRFVANYSRSYFRSQIHFIYLQSRDARYINARYVIMITNAYIVVTLNLNVRYLMSIDRVISIKDVIIPILDF